MVVFDPTVMKGDEGPDSWCVSAAETSATAAATLGAVENLVKQEE